MKVIDDRSRTPDGGYGADIFGGDKDGADLSETTHMQDSSDVVKRPKSASQNSDRPPLRSFVELRASVCAQNVCSHYSQNLRQQ